MGERMQVCGERERGCESGERDVGREGSESGKREGVRLESERGGERE